MKHQFVSFDHCPDIALFDPAPFANEDVLVHTPGAGDALRAALQLTIPPTTSCGARRRWRAGFARYVALAWVCNRGMITERTEAEFARGVGVSQQRLSYHVRYWQRLLAGEQPARATGEGDPTGGTCKSVRVLSRTRHSSGSAQRACSIVRINPEDYSTPQ
jgi:hypothetical protein